MKNNDTYIRFCIKEIWYEYSIDFVFNNVLLLSNEPWAKDCDCRIDGNRHDSGTRVLSIFSPCMFYLQLTVLGSENSLIMLKWTTNKIADFKFEVVLPSKNRYNTLIFDNIGWFCSLSDYVNNKVIKEYTLNIKEDDTCGLEIPKEFIDKYDWEDIQLECVYKFTELKNEFDKNSNRILYSMKVQLIN